MALSAVTPVSQAKQKEILFDGLGSHKRTVTARSAEAQRYFNQGLNFLYAFNHDEAIRAFSAATKADPNCSMAWWGIAMANGPHINNTFVAPAQERTAVEALARASRGSLTPSERALVNAAKTRFRFPQPKDRTTLDRAYAQAMREVWRKYPRDADVGALYAESMMDLRPWDFWLSSGKPQPGTVEITTTLDRVLKLNPNHPMALHLAIHAWEASLTPEKADDASHRLRNLQPALGHMVHMPSHIDVRRGRWQEAIVANQKAIKADEAYRARRPRQGFYRLYMAHNRHMLGFAAMMTGQGDLSIGSIDRMVKDMPTAWVKENAPFIDGLMAMPLEARVRFGRWKEVLAYPEYPTYLPLSTALRHVARGVAYAATGNLMDARAEQMLFEDAAKRVPKEFTVGNNPSAAILTIARHLLAGEILLAEGSKAAALVELRKAVHAEDQIRYDEPPDWIIPTRHILGVALLEAGKPAEAEAVYRQDLVRLPNNGWSLKGLSDALQRQGRGAEAAKARRQFQAVWKAADTQITSSCLCRPNP